MAGVKGSSRALFQAVVVMGAALAGCDRSVTPAGAVEPVKTVAPGPVPVPVEPVVVPPVKVEPVQPVVVPPVVAEEGEAKQERKTRPVKAKQESRERCPEGSEMPYPPCFYIL